METNKKIQLLGELSDFPDGTMAIGRLDKHSEGLLLLTTDGMMSYNVLSKKVEKEYYVQLDGAITDEAIQQLIDGVDISVEKEIYTTLPCQAFILDPPPNFPLRIKKIRDDRHGPTTWISITLREGKFRQIRKMTAKIGFPTLRLFRVRVGGEELGDLKAGEVKEVETFILFK